MSGNVERRALLALFRNHPTTGPGDRYKWKASAEAKRQREMLLDWAAAQPDEELLYMRNLGPVALRWIREQRGLAPSRHVHDGEWCAACVEHGRYPTLDTDALYRALLAVENHGAPIVATDYLAIAAAYAEEVER
jgi:hypothetical protein